jgi:hypothetical protein
MEDSSWPADNIVQAKELEIKLKEIEIKLDYSILVNMIQCIFAKNPHRRLYKGLWIKTLYSKKSYVLESMSWAAMSWDWRQQLLITNKSGTVRKDIKALYLMSKSRKTGIHIKGSSIPLPNIRKFIQPLSLLSALLDTVYVGKYCIGWTDFYKLLAVFKLAKKVKFYECKIDTGQPMDLSNILRGYKTNSLEFMGCETHVYSDWGTKPHLLENIIKSLGTSDDVKENLLKFSLGKKAFNKSNILSLLEDNGLQKCVNHIKIIEANKLS